jgi:hypothetical protein
VPTKGHRLETALDGIIAGFLFLFVLSQPASIAAAHISYAGAALAWSARLLFVKPRRLYSSPLDLPILIYLVLSAVSVMQSPLPASSWEGMRKVALVCVVLVVAQNVLTLTRAKQLIAVLLISGLATVAWTVWLYTGGVGLRVLQSVPDTTWFRAGLRDGDAILRVDGRRISRPQQFLEHLRAKPLADPLQLGVVPAAGIEVRRNIRPVVVPPGEWQRAGNLDQLGVRLETARPIRAFGFYSHYVTYSMVLVLLASLPFGLWLGLQERFSAAGLLLAGIFLALALALGLTLTRAAWLALAFACAVQAWFHFRQRAVRVLLPVALLLAAVATGAAMQRWRGVGLMDASDPATDYRLLMWSDGLRLIGTHPWFGVGMNSVRDAWWKYDLAAYKKYGARLHFESTPIQMAVEMGIPVLISWIVFMAWYWLMLARLVARARAQQDSFAYGLTLGILGGASGFLASSLVHYDFGDSLVVFLFWFLAGLALAIRRLLLERAVN